MILVRTALLSLRMLSRSPLRAVLAVLGIAVAVLLLCAERAMHEGVTEATSANERDTRLIVYRANRFCPLSSCSYVCPIFAKRTSSFNAVASRFR